MYPKIAVPIKPKFPSVANNVEWASVIPAPTPNKGLLLKIFSMEKILVNLAPSEEDKPTFPSINKAMDTRNFSTRLYKSSKPRIDIIELLERTKTPIKTKQPAQVKTIEAFNGVPQSASAINSRNKYKIPTKDVEPNIRTQVSMNRIKQPHHPLLWTLPPRLFIRRI